MTEALRDARAKAIFGVVYAALKPTQKTRVDDLMARSSKYATKEKHYG